MPEAAARSMKGRLTLGLLLEPVTCFSAQVLALVDPGPPGGTGKLGLFRCKRFPRPGQFSAATQEAEEKKRSKGPPRRSEGV